MSEYTQGALRTGPSCINTCGYCFSSPFGARLLAHGPDKAARCSNTLFSGTPRFASREGVQGFSDGPTPFTGSSGQKPGSPLSPSVLQNNSGHGSLSAAASGDEERGPVESQAELRSLGHNRAGTPSSPVATGPPAGYFQLLPIQHLGRKSKEGVLEAGNQSRRAQGRDGRLVKYGEVKGQFPTSEAGSSGAPHYTRLSWLLALGMQPPCCEVAQAAVRRRPNSMYIGPASPAM